MQGTAMMGSLQQSIWMKGSSSFPPKGSVVGFPPQVKLSSSIKPGRCYSQLEGSLITGRSPSSVSVPAAEIGGDGRSFKDNALSEVDLEVRALIDKEKQRQFRCLELIASENFTSRAVMEAVGSCLTSKYSEGLPGKRYYGGNEFVDELEILCQKRALAAFHLDGEKWGVNVQPLSGSPTTFEVTAILNPHDRLMSLRGPRGGMIFFKKDRVLGVDLESAINNAAFPGLQGGPYNHTIGGLAVCLKYAQSPEFKAYQKQVVSNCRSLASKLIAQGHELVSDGSCESSAI